MNTILHVITITTISKTTKHGDTPTSPSTISIPSCGTGPVVRRTLDRKMLNASNSTECGTSLTSPPPRSYSIPVTGLVICKQGSNQGCHWTFAKITENLRVRAVSQKMNTKMRQKVQTGKDETGENRE